MVIGCQREESTMTWKSLQKNTRPNSPLATSRKATMQCPQVTAFEVKGESKTGLEPVSAYTENATG